MTILKLDGRLSTDGFQLEIGGVDVTQAVREAKFSGRVTVALGDATFTGDTVYGLVGSPGYSEYTPESPAAFIVGRHNIFPLLDDMHGEIVTLWIADEPFNTLDPPPAR